MVNYQYFDGRFALYRAAIPVFRRSVPREAPVIDTKLSVTSYTPVSPVLSVTGVPIVVVRYCASTAMDILLPE